MCLKNREWPQKENQLGEKILVIKRKEELSEIFGALDVQAKNTVDDMRKVVTALSQPTI